MKLSIKLTLITIQSLF